MPLMSRVRVDELQPLDRTVVLPVKDIATKAELDALAETITGGVTQVTSIDGLIAALTTGKTEGSLSSVRGYYADPIFPIPSSQPYGQGGGLFVLTREVGTAEVPGLIFESTFEPGAFWCRRFEGDVNVDWFGAKGDDSFDNLQAMQDAHSLPYNVFYPSGHYLTSGTVEVTPGQRAYGVKGPRFPDNGMRSIIEATTATTWVFSQTLSTSPGQEDGFSASDLFLLSDRGIQLNDPTILIEDGGGAGSPYLMRSEFRRLTLRPLTDSSGTGILMSKCFDFVIEQCEFIGFDRELVLQGCDLGKVVTNRFVNIYGYGILELSCDTFGSQNLIENNDMVGVFAPTGRFIRSTSRHVRIRNNYMEQQSGDFIGFIDMSPVGVPQYGSNIPSSTRASSIDVSENRLDGWQYATAFIYRIPTDKLLSVKIHDVGTTGVPATVPWLVDELGNPPELPLLWNTTNLTTYDLKGGRGPSSDGSRFYRFETKDISVDRGGVSFNAESLTSLVRSGLIQDNAHNNVHLSDDGIVLKPELGETLFRCLLPPRSGVNNPYLRSGIDYEITIYARTRAGSETLRSLYVVNGSAVGGAIDTTLGTQASKITLTRTGSASTSVVGIAFANQSGTPSNDIIIESVTFTPTT